MPDLNDGWRRLVEMMAASRSRVATASLMSRPVVSRAMVVQVTAAAKTRGEVLSVVNIFRGKVVDVSSESYVVEVTGTEDKIGAFINLLRPFGIKEVVRTGVVAMFRGSPVLAAAADDAPAPAAEGQEGRLAREGSEADFV